MNTDAVDKQGFTFIAKVNERIASILFANI